MHTRSSKNWKSKPGNWNTLNLDIKFRSSNPEEIPDLRPQAEEVPDDLQACRWKQKYKEPWKSVLHFFTDDYRFKPLWNQKKRHIPTLQSFAWVCEPNFTITPVMPAALKRYQTYCTRYLGRYWQHNGINVIPVPNWAEPESLEYSLMGIPEYQTVAIQVPGFGFREEREFFNHGFEKMMGELKPVKLITVGKLPDDLKINIPVIRYPTYWEKRRNGQK